MKKLVLGFLILVLVSGCDNFIARIESDTSWRCESSGNGTIDGSGNQEISLEADNYVAVAVVQKDTERGYLKCTIINDSLFGTEGESESTTAAYGVVSVSN